MCGDDVRFQTGTDEHGDKIVEAAEAEGIPPKDYVDKISALFKDSWPLLQVKPDYIIRTTDKDHVSVVQQILQKVYDNGDIYFDEYTGLYCKGCERYLTEKELVDGNCPDHQKPPTEIAEQNYFFRMSRYQQQLIDHIKDNPGFITPKRYRNEVLAFLSEPLEDLCISRPKSRLTWGIELPFDDNFVTYVWFDALINYLTGVGYPEGEQFDNYWSVAEHLIAKDILKPHAIYWPTMLMSMGAPLYKKLHVHGFWLVDESKMSKSIGNVVRPRELVAEYGIDALRYFTLREMSFGLDSSFSSEAIVARQNADLANDLGNLFSRSISMLQKYCDGKIPNPGSPTQEDLEIQAGVAAMLEVYEKTMGEFRFHLALQAVWEIVSRANKYIVRNEPWVLAKDPEKAERLDTVLYNLLEILRFLTLVLRPVIPGSTLKMAEGLGLDSDDECIVSLHKGRTWGLLRPGSQIGKPGTLFPRLESSKKDAKDRGEKKSNKQNKQKSFPKEKTKTVDIGLVTFEDFQKFELRVAEIVDAEPVKKSDRLLKLTVMVPEKKTIVAGIAEFYKPLDLIGKQIIVVANLKPAKLMGVTSEGMVLAAKTEVDGKKRLVLSTVDKSVLPGSRVA